MGFIPAVNSIYNYIVFSVGVSSIGRLRQFISWQRDCVVVVNLWTEYNQFLKIVSRILLIDLLMNIILLIRTLSLMFRILHFLNNGSEWLFLGWLFIICKAFFCKVIIRNLKFGFWLHISFASFICESNIAK